MGGGTATQADLASVILPRQGEFFLGYWWGLRNEKYLTFSQALGEAAKGSASSHPTYCYLVLTNQRIAFVAEQGLFSKVRRVLETFELSNVVGVTRTRPAVVISVNLNERSIERVFGPYPGRGDPGQLLAVIQNAARERLAAIEAERQQARIQYVIDFSFLKAQLEKGGLTVSTVKCPACSGPLQLPETGNAVACTYCGVQVMAHDIFERMKGLIGNLP